MAVDLKPEEVSQILKEQLSDFEMKSESYEIGTVLSVGDGIARVHGLSGVSYSELLDLWVRPHRCGSGTSAFCASKGSPIRPDESSVRSVLPM